VLLCCLLLFVVVVVVARAENISRSIYLNLSKRERREEREEREKREIERGREGEMNRLKFDRARMAGFRERTFI